MEPIASFTIDHNRLQRGVYVSRKDPVGGTSVTTFDIRMKLPNREPVLDIPALHTIEHIGATWLRNHSEWGSRVLYFGPMGCRTGVYLLAEGDLSSRDILPLVTGLFLYLRDFTGPVPGATAEGCGNYLSQDLPIARWEAEKFLSETLNGIRPEQLTYPE